MDGLAQMIEDTTDVRELKRAVSVKLGQGGMATAAIGELLHVTARSVLSLANRLPDFPPRARTERGPKGLESQQRTYQSLPGSVILFRNVVEILALPNREGCPVNLIVVVNRCRVALTLINRKLLREPLGPNRLV